MAITSDPKPRIAALRAWFEQLVADPAKGAAAAKQMLEIAGDLYDDGHLDGQQYHIVYELGRSLKEPGMPGTVELAKTCLAAIS